MKRYTDIHGTLENIRQAFLTLEIDPEIDADMELIEAQRRAVDVIIAIVKYWMTEHNRGSNPGLVIPALMDTIGGALFNIVKNTTFFEGQADPQHALIHMMVDTLNDMLHRTLATERGMELEEGDEIVMGGAIDLKNEDVPN